MTGWVNDYVGLPYREGGRGRSGVDCWGLVCMVYREQRAIELPDADTKRALRGVFAGGGHAERIEMPEPWAIVISACRHRPYHAGICVAERYVLHASRRGVICPPAMVFDVEYSERSFWRWQT